MKSQTKEVDLGSLSKAECARIAGLNIRSLTRRLERGMSLHDAVYSPKHQHAEHCQVLVTIGKRTQCVRYWCLELGLSESAYNNRVRKGMTPCEALTSYNPRNRKTTEERRADRIKSRMLGGSPSLIQIRKNRIKRGISSLITDTSEAESIPPMTPKVKGRKQRKTRVEHELSTIGCII